MLPGAEITNQDGNTGVSPQADPTGILAIIAACSGGAASELVASLYTDWATALVDHGYGPLTELAAYQLNTAQKPVLLIRSPASTAGDMGVVDNSLMVGACRGSAGATEPLDRFDIEIQFVTAGTVGVTGITYKVSLDGGETFGPPIALGTSTSIVPTNTNATIDLTSATVVAADILAVTTTGPVLTASDFTAALEALKQADLPWEAVLLDAEAGSTEIAALDTWLSGLETVGEYHTGALNSRFRDLAASESEATFATAMAAIRTASAGTIRAIVGTDGEDLISPIRSIFMRRPASSAVAAREMSVDLAVMASYIADGNLANARITTPTGAPKYHNEQKSPGLDDLGFCTLRTVPRHTGAYNTLTRLFSPAGSDWVFWPHARVMNKAKSLAYDELTAQCSIGVHVRKNPQNPSVKNITEADAQKLEGLVQSRYDTEIVPKRASAATFSLMRNDDLSSNGGNTLTGTIAIDGLRYIVKFAVTAKFV